MAKHQRHYRRRRNPLGISSGVLKDSGYNAAGALGALFLAGKFGGSGWMGVGVTAASALGLKFVGKMFVGESESEELLKGGLTAAIIAAIHQAGFASSLGLGSYVQSYFAVPTSSDSYGRAATPQYALPPAPAKGMGYHRFRSRYAGNYGG